MERIKTVIKKLIKDVYYVSRKKICIQNEDNNIYDIEKYEKFIRANQNISYNFSSVKTTINSAKHKWVGAQYSEGKIYFIPNDSKVMLVIDCESNRVSDIDIGKTGLFKWTGGCVHDGKIYAYPRSDNNLLCIDTITYSINLYPTCDFYKQEHHYGGVRTSNNVIIQPPRNTNSILVWKLNDKSCEKIRIAPKWMRLTFRYCGSIYHPNGYVYLLPEKNDKVIKLNPVTMEWHYIGKKITAYVFDAVVAIDGNIYGYSAYAKGILKIDVKTDHVGMIHREFSPGAYGTKIGLNGKLYSVPGDGRYVWEYDVENDILISVVDLKDEQKAKYAGGCVAPNGDIYFCPATAESIGILRASSDRIISKKLYEEYWNDNY